MELKDNRTATFTKHFLKLILIFLLLSGFKVNAEMKRDTLVFKAHRDTLRLVKAQINLQNDGTERLYFRPKPFQFARNVPSDIWMMGKTAFSKRNLPRLGAILAASALLTTIDQPVTDAAMQFGRYIHLEPDRKSRTVIEFNIGSFHVNAMELPDNTNSAIYYLGEGWASMSIAGGFYSYGLVARDYRAIQTASQITESIFALGFTTQFLKRITGRQSPFRAMESPNGVPGGDWHPFPNPSRYQKSVSNFDAFPSGHMATAMATVTILAGNYPDAKFIRPVGYTLIGLLGYSMLNNGVHWISDYPLAIAIGYTCGKIALSRGSQRILKPGTELGSSKTLTPIFMGQGNIGLCYRVIF
jgi:hypothetical protein